MATYYSSYNNQYRLRLDLNQQSRNNTSVISYALYLENGNSHFINHRSVINITINGTTVYSDRPMVSIPSMNRTTLLRSGTITVGHNADGTKSLPFSASFDLISRANYTPQAPLNISGSMNLTRNITASTASSKNGNIKNPFPITVNRRSGNHYLDIYLEAYYSGKWNVLNVQYGATGNISLAIPSNKIEEIGAVAGNSNDVRLRVRVITKNGSGGPVVGTTYSSEFKGSLAELPTLTSFKVTDINSTTQNILQNSSLILQNKSTVNVYVYGLKAFNGAKVTSVTCSILGNSKTNNVTTDSTTFNMGTVNKSGRVAVQVSIRDNRGNLASYIIDEDIIPYDEPQLIRAEAERENSFGTRVYLNADFKKTTVTKGSSDVNKLSVRYRVKESNYGSWSSYTNVSVSNNKITNRFMSTYPTDKSYDVEISYKDSFSSYKSKIIYITEAKGLVEFYRDRVQVGTKVEIRTDGDTGSQMLEFRDDNGKLNAHFGRHPNDKFYSINDYTGEGINVYTAGKFSHNGDRLLTEKDISVENISNRIYGSGVSDVQAFKYGRVVTLTLKAKVNNSWASINLTMPEEYRPMGEVVLSTRVNAQADFDMELSALLQQNGNIGTVAKKASTNVITFTGTYICRG